MKDVDLQWRFQDSTQGHQFSSDESCHIAIDGHHGMSRSQQRRCRRIDRRQRPGARLFADQVIVGLTPSMRDQTVGRCDSGVDTGDDRVAQFQRQITRMTLRDVRHESDLLDSAQRQGRLRGAFKGQRAVDGIPQHDHGGGTPCCFDFLDGLFDPFVGEQS